MPHDHDAPGLARRKNSNGTYRYYWIAANCARDTKDFRPPTQRLIGTTDAERAGECRKLYAELMEWLSGQERANYDGTLGSLIALYQTHENSPFQSVREKTRAGYTYNLGVLERVVGKRTMNTLTGIDFMRWHAGFMNPEGHDGAPKVRHAQALITQLREVMKFGQALGIGEAKHLTSVLRDLRFKSPKQRKAFISFEQAEAIMTAAIDAGRISIALGQALQFDLTLRQYDVTGYWEKVDRDEIAQGFVHNGKIWRYGLTWNHIDTDLVLRKDTSKTGQRAEFRLPLYELVVRALEHVPADARVGPVIIDEATGRPYSNGRYSRIWRRFAREAGVPDAVMNRDSRAGGITEATDAAGSEENLEHVRHHAQHSNITTTQRYSRNTLEKTTNVAVLRARHRHGKNGA